MGKERKPETIIRELKQQHASDLRQMRVQLERLAHEHDRLKIRCAALERENDLARRMLALLERREVSGGQ